MYILVNFENWGTCIHRCPMNEMYGIMLHLFMMWFTDILADLDMQTELQDC